LSFNTKEQSESQANNWNVEFQFYHTEESNYRNKKNKYVALPGANNWNVEFQFYQTQESN